MRTSWQERVSKQVERSGMGEAGGQETHMRRDDVIATLGAHERELKGLGIRRLAVFRSVA